MATTTTERSPHLVCKAVKELGRRMICVCEGPGCHREAADRGDGRIARHGSRHHGEEIRRVAPDDRAGLREEGELLGAELPRASPDGLFAEDPSSASGGGEAAAALHRGQHLGGEGDLPWLEVLGSHEGPRVERLQKDRDRAS